MAIALSGSSDDRNNVPGGSSAGSSSASSVAAAAKVSSSESSKKGPNEMVGGCAVCLDENGSEENPLVYCDGCELAVHQACYGIDRIPPGNWFCSKCASGESHNNIKCELCPTKDGALKRTETGSWAHVICGLYIPEVRFSNTNTMEPIEIRHISKERYVKTCYICEESGNSAAASYGAKRNCEKMGCKQLFHVTCAQAAGLLREEYSPGSDVISYCGYCKHHFRKLKADYNKKRDHSSNNNNNNNINNNNNPSSSSILDSASDSSQDNDSRRNTASEQPDKNNSNRTRALPTNLSSNETSTLANNNARQLLSSPTLISNSKVATQLANIAPISLTVSTNSAGSSGKIPSSTITGPNVSTTSQKKKRATKSTQGNNGSGEQASNNNPSTLLATISSSFSTQPTTGNANAPSGAASSSPQDVYDWPTGNKEVEKNISPSKANKKKPSPASATSNATQSLGSKSVLSNNQQQVASVYHANKIGSPNLSISTSPSLSSPSNSTKSTSNSSTSSTSTTATASSSSSSSSSSTTSNSPSPALLSPSISNRGSTVRLESPLASNSKTSTTIISNKLPTESLATNSTAPALNSIISSRINLDNPRPDVRKSLTVSSSLLSTAVPMLNPSSSATLTPKAAGISVAGDTNLTSKSNILDCTDMAVKNNFPSTSTTSKPDTAQPTIPPLIIPVPQGSASSSPTKTAAKPRAPARNTKRKATENTAVTKPEPDQKPKTSRSKKVASTQDAAAVVNQKPEPKRRRAKAKPNETPAQGSEQNQEETNSKAAAPTKRKSRAASIESNPNPAPPSPAKRIRKKKTDNPAPSSESKPTANPALNLPNNSQTSMNTLMGTSPLMISTPALTNPVPVAGFNTVEGQGAGNKYYSPMISPYTNYDQTALNRPSLSRLFMSSSVSAGTPNPPDDPTKAFEELRDNSWSHLSKCVLDQAQQFDLPHLIGTLYALRSENEKLNHKVRELTSKKDQLIAMNARLEMPGPALTHHLSSTSPNFSSLMSGLTNSPKSLPASSPGSALGKQPMILANAPYNQIAPGPMGPHGFLDRSSPLVGQTHSTISNIKSSTISTPSPPISALMAHSNSNRAGLITANAPYMQNTYQQINATGQINSTPQGSSFYPRQ